MMAYTLFKNAYTQYMSQVVWDISDKSTIRNYLNQAFIGMLGQYSLVGGDCNGFRLEFDIRIDVDDNVGADADVTNPADIATAFNPAEFDVDEIIANKTLVNTKCLKDIRLYDGFWLCHHNIVTGTWTFSHHNFKREAVKSARGWSKYSKKHQDWYLIVKIGYKGLNE